MHHTRINCLITREIQNNFVELNHTRDETVDTRVTHFPEQPSSPDGNHTMTFQITLMQCAYTFAVVLFVFWLQKMAAIVLWAPQKLSPFSILLQ